MKTIPVIFSKLLAKAAALLILSVLTIFTGIFKAALFLYCIIAIPFAMIGTLLTAYDWISGSFTYGGLFPIVFCISLVVLRYALPLLVPVLNNTIEKLQDFVRAPLSIRVKSPVRYTL